MEEVKYEIKENEEKKGRGWRSCCFELDSHMVAYVGQFTFSMSVLGFCALMLIKADGSCEQSSSYINIISFMMGKILSTVMTSSDK
jgi:hypothetical protein